MFGPHCPVVEALIGAVYLDKGFSIVERLILNLWKKHIKASAVTQIDPKTKLQEYSLKKFKKLPTYKVISNTGPRHKPLFKVGVKFHRDSINRDQYNANFTQAVGGGLTGLNSTSNADRNQITRGAVAWFEDTVKINQDWTILFGSRFEAIEQFYRNRNSYAPSSKR